AVLQHSATPRAALCRAELRDGVHVRTTEDGDGCMADTVDRHGSAEARIAEDDRGHDSGGAVLDVPSHDLAEPPIDHLLAEAILAERKVGPSSLQHLVHDGAVVSPERGEMRQPLVEVRDRKMRIRESEGVSTASHRPITAKTAQ